MHLFCYLVNNNNTHYQCKSILYFMVYTNTVCKSHCLFSTNLQTLGLLRPTMLNLFTHQSGNQSNSYECEMARPTILYYYQCTIIHYIIIITVYFNCIIVKIFQSKFVPLLLPSPDTGSDSEKNQSCSHDSPQFCG